MAIVFKVEVCKIRVGIHVRSRDGNTLIHDQLV